MATIALLTDFGTSDWFVGSMKAVISAINPTATIIDITHQIQQGDIKAAAVVLKSCYSYFPQETVFVVVIDPGVGSHRKAVAVRDHNRLFVAPDNGVLSMILSDTPRVHHITETSLFNHPVSNTFHGRDIFAPVGAHLSNGTPLNMVGPKVTNLETLPLPRLRKTGKSLEAEVIYIDHFGNAFTSATFDDLRDSGYTTVELPNGTTIPIHDHYAAVASFAPLGLVNSEGYLEIAVNGGNAAKELNISVGSIVTIQ